MNLSLDNDAGGAGIDQFPGRGFRRLASFHHFALRHCYPVFLQDSLGLVLMNFHNDSCLDLSATLGLQLWAAGSKVDSIEGLSNRANDIVLPSRSLRPLRLKSLFSLAEESKDLTQRSQRSRRNLG